MKRVYLVDPLECPRCGKPMKIIAFIQKRKEIEKIAKHLGYPAWRAPPEIFPYGGEPYVDSGPEFNQTLE